MLENAIAYVGQLGWKSQIGLIIYSAPIVIWGLGAAEGAVRTAFNGIASVFARHGNIPEKAQTHWIQCQRDAGITRSCAAITAVSLVPVLGTGFGYWEFNNQCKNYSKIKGALEKIKQGQYLETMDHVLLQLDKTPEVTEDALNHLYQELANPSTQRDVSQANLNLPASLIYNYYGYSIVYFALDKTSASIQFTAGKVKQIIVYLSRNNIIKKVAICAFNAIKNEVNQTLEDTVNNRRQQKVS